MEQFWYKHELLHYEKVLNNLLNTNNTNIKQIKENIEVLNLFKEIEKTSFDMKDILLKDYTNLTKTKFLWKYIENASRLDTTFIPNIKEKEFKLSNKDLIEILNDFFKNATDKKTYELFLKIYKDNKKSIHIINKENYYPGDTLYIEYFNKTYIQIYKSNTFDDITTLAHEFGHAIQYNTNYNINYFKNLSAYVEIISVFFELLANEYFYKTEFKNNAILSEYDLFIDNIGSCKDLKEEFKILNKVSIKDYENKLILKERINNYIKELPINYINYFIDLIPSDFYIYSFAFIVASNIYNIYKKDKEFAFLILYEIINIDLRINAYEYYQELEKLDLLKTDGLKAIRHNIKRRCK